MIIKLIKGSGVMPIPFVPNLLIVDWHLIAIAKKEVLIRMSVCPDRHLFQQSRDLAILETKV